MEVVMFLIIRYVVAFVICCFVPEAFPSVVATGIESFGIFLIASAFALFGVIPALICFALITLFERRLLAA